jgi:hypothetical protein
MPLDLACRTLIRLWRHAITPDREPVSPLPESLRVILDKLELPSSADGDTPRSSQGQPGLDNLSVIKLHLWQLEELNSVASSVPAEMVKRVPIAAKERFPASPARLE